MKKKVIIAVAIMLLLQAVRLQAIEFGLFAGKLNESKSTLVGISSSSGFLVPMVKFETEYYIFTAEENSEKVLTGAIKFQPRLGIVSPYAALGLGSRFHNLDSFFRKKSRFTFLGLGAGIHLMPMLTLRLDVRFQKFSKEDDENFPEIIDSKTKYTRISAGLFLNL